MKLNLFFAALLSTVILTSCGGEKKNDKKEEKKDTTAVVTAPKPEILPNAVAELGIKGMVCEINCVGSVKKTVLALAGVASWDMEFDSEKEVNHARVKFDKTQVSEKQMVDAIHHLHDGQYKVESIEVRDMTEEEKKTEAATSEVIGEIESVEEEITSGGSIAMPNIFDVFGSTL
ncbi:MAG: heavy-metal-associated domain-containing protein [Bacteroidota bacterium]